MSPKPLQMVACCATYFSPGSRSFFWCKREERKIFNSSWEEMFPADQIWTIGVHDTWINHREQNHAKGPNICQHEVTDRCTRYENLPNKKFWPLTYHCPSINIVSFQGKTSPCLNNDGSTLPTVGELAGNRCQFNLWQDFVLVWQCVLVPIAYQYVCWL